MGKKKVAIIGAGATGVELAAELHRNTRAIISYGMDRVDPEKDIHKTRIDYLLPKSIVDLCKGNELVSGKQVHIREGVVLRPYIDRNAVDGTKLRLKIINPAYRETGEEIN